MRLSNLTSPELLFKGIRFCLRKSVFTLVTPITSPSIHGINHKRITNAEENCNSPVDTLPWNNFFQFSWPLPHLPIFIFDKLIFHQIYNHPKQRHSWNQRFMLVVCALVDRIQTNKKVKYYFQYLLKDRNIRPSPVCVAKCYIEHHKIKFSHLVVLPLDPIKLWQRGQPALVVFWFVVCTWLALKNDFRLWTGSDSQTLE